MRDGEGDPSLSFTLSLLLWRSRQTKRCLAYFLSSFVLLSNLKCQLSHSRIVFVLSWLLGLVIMLREQEKLFCPQTHFQTLSPNKKLQSLSGSCPVFFPHKITCSIHAHETFIHSITMAIYFIIFCIILISIFFLHLIHSSQTG